MSQLIYHEKSPTSTNYSSLHKDIQSDYPVCGINVKNMVDLPVEILLLIWRKLDITSRNNLASTNRYMHELSWGPLWNRVVTLPDLNYDIPTEFKNWLITSPVAKIKIPIILQSNPSQSLVFTQEKTKFLKTFCKNIIECWFVPRKNQICFPKPIQISYYVSCMPKLRAMDLYSMKEIGGADLDRILNLCPNLKILRADKDWIPYSGEQIGKPHQTTDAHLITLGKRELSILPPLLYCKDISEQGISGFLVDGILQNYCTTLTLCRNRWSPNDIILSENQFKLSNQTYSNQWSRQLIYAILGCVNLEKLILRDFLFSLKSITELIGGFKMSKTNLKLLDLNIGSKSIDDPLLENICSFKNLEYLCIGYNQNISDAGIKSCSKLKHLYHFSCFGNGQISIKGLEHLSNVKTLIIPNSGNVEIKKLKFSEAIWNVKYLDIRNCIYDSTSLTDAFGDPTTFPNLQRLILKIPHFQTGSSNSANRAPNRVDIVKLKTIRRNITIELM